MGTGASATQVIHTGTIVPEDDSPQSKVSVTKITPIKRRKTLARVESFEREFREQEQKAFAKTLEEIFGAESAEPGTSGHKGKEPVREINKLQDNPVDAGDDSSDDSRLDMVVLLSSEDIETNKKELSSTSVGGFDEKIMDELSSLAVDIDTALEGHEEIMHEMRGMSLMSTVSSFRGSEVSIDGPNALRPKGSTISPLPGVIPVRVNWVNSEKLTEQEKKLISQRAEAEVQRFTEEVMKRPTPTETPPKVVKPRSEIRPEPTGSAGAGDRQEEAEEGPSPRIDVSRTEYSNDEKELMRNIEKEFGL